MQEIRLLLSAVQYFTRVPDAAAGSATTALG